MDTRWAKELGELDDVVLLYSDKVQFTYVQNPILMKEPSIWMVRFHFIG